MKLKTKQQSDFSRDARSTVTPPELASEQIGRERNARRMKRFVRIQKRARFHAHRQPAKKLTLRGGIKAWIVKFFVLIH